MPTGSDSNSNAMITPAHKINIGFTDAAIAGLASKEDFTRVKLKRSESSSSSYSGEFPPFHDLMLIQIKGYCFMFFILLRKIIKNKNNSIKF